MFSQNSIGPTWLEDMHKNRNTSNHIISCCPTRTDWFKSEGSTRATPPYKCCLPPIYLGNVVDLGDRRFWWRGLIHIKLILQSKLWMCCQPWRWLASIRVQGLHDSIQIHEDGKNCVMWEQALAGFSSRLFNGNEESESRLLDLTFERWKDTDIIVEDTYSRAEIVRDLLFAQITFRLEIKIKIKI